MPSSTMRLSTFGIRWIRFLGMSSVMTNTMLGLLLGLSVWGLAISELMKGRKRASTMARTLAFNVFCGAILMSPSYLTQPLITRGP
jgi:hypothetical protein